MFCIDIYNMVVELRMSHKMIPVDLIKQLKYMKYKEESESVSLNINLVTVYRKV